MRPEGCLPTVTEQRLQVSCAGEQALTRTWGRQVGARGNDEQGAAYEQSMLRSGVDVSGLRVHEGSTGAHRAGMGLCRASSLSLQPNVLQGKPVGEVLALVEVCGALSCRR